MKHLGRCYVPLVISMFGWGLSARASAQALKPYFLVIVDTSGSMSWCAGGTEARLGADDCSCYVGNDCNSALMTNRCGFSSNKIGDAKCALQRILDGTGGDAVFGLMQFTHPCDDSCGATTGACGSSCNGSSCGDGQLDVAISDGNQNVMREWVDGACDQGSCNAGDFRHELTTGEWTPLAKSLQRAEQYLRDGVGPSGVPYVTGGAAPASPIANDSLLKCRPVSVILLTDGQDTCTGDPNGDPPAAAASLHTGDEKAGDAAGKAFRTYVIGFGKSGGNFNETVLSNVAASGGTDAMAMDAQGNAVKYFPASNEAELSVALGKIIADAQPPQEVCNGLDDDCDGAIDEDVPKFCDKPHGVNDATLCTMPPETKCDGQDDNCNGVIDEGLTNACGACGPVPKEQCNGVDDDCDGRVDEDTDDMMSCGNAKGECKPGTLVCQSGAEQCRGAIGPTQEACDCKDNDCDGSVDEDDGMLCPEGQKCAGCKCVEYCSGTPEFMGICAKGLTPEFEPNGECLCVVDTCDHDACPQSMIMRKDSVACAPNDPSVTACICKAGACVSVCDGVTCGGGDACDPRSGRCVENNCRGLGCLNGELCDPDSGRCMEDACANAHCQADQACRGGMCEASCVSVKCQATERCSQGACVADPCTGVSCDQDLVCDPNSGNCVADPCAGMTCERGQTCSQGSGKCQSDGCWNVTCPSGQRCLLGECSSENPSRGASGQNGGDASANNALRQRFLATGGGGCSCSAPGALGKRVGMDAAWLFALAWLARRMRARRARRTAPP